ncbi:hypothetical protein [Burkholderia anthina]|uniref:hypothetical protein n=1 Tax=Burkholderia anthina TaxID=179879 RepID=UPI0037BEF474
MGRQHIIGAGDPVGGSATDAVQARATLADTVRAGIRGGATGLVFGKAVQDALGVGSYFLGTAIHFAFALSWGIVFAVIWPWFRRRGFEATFVALFFAIVAWIVMHVLIMIASSNHPNYFDPNVIIGGFMSHFVFAVPLALVVKRSLAPQPYGRT